jgi:diamine N-acetyltransferase
MGRQVLAPVIRIATQEDLVLLSEMGAKAFQETYEAYNTEEDMQLHISATYSIPAIREGLTNRLSTYLIAFKEERALGYAKITRNNCPAHHLLEKPVELERLYVLKDAIGYGVGAALMQQCIGTAVKEGYRTLWLGVWEKNIRAVHFYRRWGFEQFASHKFLLGKDLQDDWLMKKTLV